MGRAVSGHVHDDASGLTYMQARYYHPVVGRFLSNDPVGFAEGGTGHFNRYAYTSNDPMNKIDPDGKQERYPSPSESRASQRNLDTLRKLQPVLEAQTEAMHKKQGSIASAALGPAAMVRAAPAMISRNLAISGAAIGGEIAATTNAVNQLSQTGAVDPIEMGITTLQGAAQGAIAGSAQRYTSNQGAGIDGQIAGITTSLAVVGSQVNGFLEGVKSVSNGGSFSEGYANGVVSGIVQSYTAGAMHPNSQASASAVGTAVDEVTKDAID